VRFISSGDIVIRLYTTRLGVAKLVPATCPKCGASVRLDPDREFVTCQFCGASSFVQTQKRQVTQYVQAHAMPVIQVPHAVGALSGCSGAIVIAVVSFGVVTAIAVGAFVYVRTLGVSAVLPTPVGVATSVLNGGRVESSAPLVEEDYYADATRAKARYEKVLGKPIMAKQLTLLQYYATLEAQDPKNHEHVDSYKLWANSVERPQPVQLGSQKQELEQLLFSLDTVDFRLLPKVIKQALDELHLEDGKVQVITLSRDGEKKQPVWRVIVNGSRENGVVEFSVTGAKLRTFH
jgi:hypothetical protein